MTSEQNSESLDVSYFKDVVINPNVLDNLHSVILLLNNKCNPVGALYLDLIDYSSVKILQTENMDEKYAVVYQGVLIYFSAWKKISSK